MKKIIYYLAFALLLSGVSSCATNRHMAVSRTSASAQLYGSDQMLSSYANVHQRAPIN